MENAESAAALLPNMFWHWQRNILNKFSMSGLKQGAICWGYPGIVVRNMLVMYDRANQQIGFLRTNCSDLWSILPAESPTVPTPPSNNQSSPSDTPDSTASVPSNEVTPPPPPQQIPPSPAASPTSFSKSLQLS
jgi:hypothetical protein